MLGTVRFKTPLWVVYLAAAVGLLTASFFVPQDSVFAGSREIEEPGKATLAAFDQLTKLVVSLNTAMFTAAAAMAVKGREWSSVWTRLDSILTVLVFACSAASYFGVFLCYVRLISMTAVGALDVAEAQLAWALGLQYWGLIAGVVALGLIFVRMLDGRLPDAPAAPKRPRRAKRP